MTEHTPSSFMWANSYIDETENLENWLIEPLIPAEGIINIYGKPKTGKSFAALGMAIAVSSGESNWNGFAIKQHGPVAYLQVDTPRGEWKSRLRKIREMGGHDVSKIAVMDMYISPYPYNILLPQHQTWLRQQIETVAPVLVIIDTLREAHEGDENNSTDMKKVINQIVRLARPAAVILVSHSRKDNAASAMGAESDLMDEGRGSGYVSGRMDTIMKFTGRRGKGHMTFKGRSVEETKLPIVQDEMGLVIVEGRYAEQEQATVTMLKQHGQEWSINKMANELVAAKMFGSNATARRHLEKHLKLLKDSEKSST